MIVIRGKSDMTERVFCLLHLSQLAKTWVKISTQAGMTDENLPILLSRPALNTTLPARLLQTGS